ncbi:class I SAM-dependent methyltransferase [Singulisphaera sp. PoT]|uniref:class I SAM-dependent methyltransferase n=1 Tax=Singulisphaera sp. PoT TaxID=3411797 RepID=UPI003BF5C74E
MKTETMAVRDCACVCPACHAGLAAGDDCLVCFSCDRTYRDVAGMPDLRLGSDRYLSLEAERAKAERLHAIGADTDLRGAAEAYYAMTDDVVDARRDRFLRHIGMAEFRGEALYSLLPQKGRILEVGCGTGGLLVPALRGGRSIVGVDIASRWLVVARRRLRDHGLDTELVAASAETLPWPDASFDVIVADSLLEHVDNPILALREWRRVLKPGGSLIVWSPNRRTLTVDPHVGLWGIGWLPRSLVPGYLRLRGKDVWPPHTLSAREAGGLARAAGLDAVRVGPATIPDDWSRRLPKRLSQACRVYSTMRANVLTRGLLQEIGPLWELRAAKSRPGLEGDSE